MYLTTVFFSQFAEFKTADGHKLPAADRHAHSKNLLLHQWGSGIIPQLPNRNSENHVQPGDV